MLDDLGCHPNIAAPWCPIDVFPSPLPTASEPYRPHAGKSGGGLTRPANSPGQAEMAGVVPTGRQSVDRNGSQQLAHLVRHDLNRGNVLEGPLRDRIAGGRNPVAKGRYPPN